MKNYLFGIPLWAICVIVFGCSAAFADTEFVVPWKYVESSSGLNVSHDGRFVWWYSSVLVDNEGIKKEGIVIYDLKKANLRFVSDLLPADHRLIEDRYPQYLQKYSIVIMSRKGFSDKAEDYEHCIWIFSLKDGTVKRIDAFRSQRGKFTLGTAHNSIYVSVFREMAWCLIQYDNQKKRLIERPEVSGLIRAQSKNGKLLFLKPSNKPSEDDYYDYIKHLRDGMYIMWDPQKKGVLGKFTSFTKTDAGTGLVSISNNGDWWTCHYYPYEKDYRKSKMPISILVDVVNNEIHNLPHVGYLYSVNDRGAVLFEKKANSHKLFIKGFNSGSRVLRKSCAVIDAIWSRNKIIALCVDILASDKSKKTEPKLLILDNIVKNDESL